MTKKRMLAFVLALLMCLTVLPAGALAANDGELVSNAPETIGDYKVELNGSNAAIVEYLGSGGAVSIPETIKKGTVNYTVNVIGATAFQGKSITSLTIPKTVKTIRGGAFAEIPGLTSVTINGDIDSCDPDSPIFSKSGASLKVTFGKDVAKIPAGIFKGSNVASVKIQSSVTVGDSAFEDCTFLKTITGDSKITSIGSSAFGGCTALTGFTFASGVKLGEYAFEGCSALTSLTFKGNMTIAGEGDVFVKAGSDITATFESAVTKIGDLFTVSGSGKPKVTKVVFQGKAPSISANAFKGITATAYHPSDDSWTPVVMQNYGGTLTWKTADAVKITTQPKAVSVKASEKATFKVVAEGTELSYQWQVKVGSNDWTDLSGKTKATLTLTATASMDGNKYRCVVSNLLGEKKSSEVKLTILAKPTISTQPADAVVNEGKTASFKVKASGGELKYQWYYQEYGTNIWTKIKGATSATYKFKATRDLNKYKYRCRVKNSAGTTYTNAAKLTVHKKAAISTQPKDKTVKAGKTVTFKVKASGYQVKYQWYYRTSSKGAWKAVPNEWSKSLTITAKKKMNGYQYRCKVYNDFSSVYSKVATLKIGK